MNPTGYGTKRDMNENDNTDNIGAGTSARQLDQPIFSLTESDFPSLPTTKKQQQNHEQHKANVSAASVPDISHDLSMRDVVALPLHGNQLSSQESLMRTSIMQPLSIEVKEYEEEFPLLPPPKSQNSSASVTETATKGTMTIDNDFDFMQYVANTLKNTCGAQTQTDNEVTATDQQMQATDQPDSDNAAASVATTADAGNDNAAIGEKAAGLVSGGVDVENVGAVGGSDSANLPNPKHVRLDDDGNFEYIPPNMVQDEYGMAGLVKIFAKAKAKSDSTLLTMGINVNDLDLNLASPGPIWPTFSGPFDTQSCRAPNEPNHVPRCYVLPPELREKLPKFEAEHLSEDLLFFTFYTCVNDVKQVETATTLYDRGWRYHIKNKYWVKRIAEVEYKQNETMEEGLYLFFEQLAWKVVQRFLSVDVRYLEDRHKLIERVRRM